jgi:hypothetical protein
MSWKRSSFAAMLAIASAAAPAAARAETLVLAAQMSAAAEAPPNPSAGVGHVDATLDTQTRRLTWTVTYSGLTGRPIAAHFHGPTQPGKNAGIVLPFPSPVSPIKGSKVLSEQQAKDVAAGLWYANVHTDRNPGGEIRGQLVPAH